MKKMLYAISLSFWVAFIYWPTHINGQQTNATQNDREVVQSVFFMHQSSCNLVFALLTKKTQCFTSLSFWIALVCWPLTHISGQQTNTTQNDREVVQSVFFVHQSSRNLVFALLTKKTQCFTALSFWIVLVCWPLTLINGLRKRHSILLLYHFELRSSIGH
jgi:hypothetical protein